MGGLEGDDTKDQKTEGTDSNDGKYGRREGDDRTAGRMVEAGAIGRDEADLETSVSTGTGCRSIAHLTSVRYSYWTLNQ